MQIAIYAESKGSPLYGVIRTTVKDSRDQPSTEAGVKTRVMLDTDGRVGANHTKPWTSVHISFMTHASIMLHDSRLNKPNAPIVGTPP